MKKEKNILQYVIMVVFGFAGIFALLVFAGVIQIGSKVSKFSGEVVLWGTVPSNELREMFSGFNKEHKKEFSVVYRSFFPEEFDEELTEALASGRGPDLMLLPDNLIVRHEDKVFPIPFDSYPLVSFQNTFVEEGELFILEEGILALPIYIDPLVLYWNRDLFSSAGIALPPQYWDELLLMAPRLSIVDENTSKISRSAVALGDVLNINNAKAILSALILQAGDDIIVRGKDDILTAVLGDFKDGGISAAESAIRFYTEFANPSRPTYSWNRALPEAQRAFVGNQVAMYFGFASELDSLREKNTHLNFRTAQIPQIRGTVAEKTFGRIVGISALKTSKNLQTAFEAMFALSSTEISGIFADAAHAVPTQRVVLSNKANADPNQSIFFDSALIARGWLDPAPEKTKGTFITMVENVVSGRDRESEAVNRANASLKRFLAE